VKRDFHILIKMRALPFNTHLNVWIKMQDFSFNTSVNYLKIFAFVQYFHLTHLRDSISSLMELFSLQIFYNRLLEINVACSLDRCTCTASAKITFLKLFNFSADVCSCWLDRKTCTRVPQRRGSLQMLYFIAYFTERGALVFLDTFDSRHLFYLL